MTERNKRIALIDPSMKPMWLNITRRLQAAANKSNCAAFVTITVVVDEGGNPQFWMEPRVVKIEPRSMSAQIIDMVRDWSM